MATFADLKDILVIRLNNWSDSPASTPEITEDEMIAMIADKSGPAKVSQVINSLSNEGLIIQTSAGPIAYELLPELFSRAEEIEAQSKPDTRPVGSSFVLDTSTLAEAPASDRVVQLDHNSKEYRIAVEALDAVIDEVRKNNEYGDKDLQDRDQRVAELEAGKRLLEAPKVSVNAIQAVIITTLAYLAMKFADAAIGNLASQAIDAVKNLVGL